MLKLYDYMQCPFGQKARIVLAEKQLDYELVPVDLRKNEQFEASFVEMSPFHKVPVLVDEEGEEDERRPPPPPRTLKPSPLSVPPSVLMRPVLKARAMLVHMLPLPAQLQRLTLGFSL